MEKIFKALSDKTRVELFLLISKQPDICLCDLEKFFLLNTSTISRHLKELHHVGLLDVKKNSTWKYYKISNLGNEYIEFICSHYDTESLAAIQLKATNITRSNKC